MKVVYKLHPVNPITGKFRAEPVNPFEIFDLTKEINISDHIKNKFRTEIERGQKNGFKYVIVDLKDIFSELDVRELIEK